MELLCIPGEFTVCRVSELTAETLAQDFVFAARTDEELSLVCRTEAAPAETLAREDGWRAFRIRGVLDFSLIGILAPIAQLLAEKRIGIFAVSTFNTDYILVKAAQFCAAMEALKQAGYTVSGEN